MKKPRGVLLHLGVLFLAAILAFRVFTRDEKLAAAQQDQVEVWGGRPSSLKSLSFEADKRKVALHARKDSHGRWYVGTIEKVTETTPPAPPQAGDAGAQASSTPKKPETKRETTYLVSVKEGEKLAESLAPMMAVRALGKLAPARAEEFGLNKPEGTLRVTIDAKQHSLIIGGLTPSGSDRYVKNPQTNEVFAISGEVVRSLMFADSRLMERALHAFEEGELTRVKITRKNASRELVRLEDKKEGWADAKNPGKLDETVGNWMAKLDRLTATQHLEQVGVPVLPEYQIVRVDYFNGSRPIGFLELIEIPESKGNAGYMVKTEYTRWYAQVMKSAAEQVEQDLSSVLK